MLRLTVLLCAAIFVTLLIAGEDKGQMRPGLAAAVAKGEEIVVLERRTAAPVAVVEEAVVEVAAAAAPAPLEAAVLEPAPAVAEAGPKVTPDPVFTLSALPTVAVDTTTAEEPVEEVAAAEVPAEASGEIWYVTANSVNVREGPSTDASIVEKLGRGEAVTVSFEPGSEWAKVSIEGDGLEGYIALRFLSPEAP